MAESTLSLTVTDLKAEIGGYLGYGRGVDVYAEPVWTTAQVNNITAVLRSGLSQVYTPPPIGPQETSHNWSWLRPFVNLQLLLGTNSLNLPDDFGGFEGPIVLTGDSTRRFFPIPLTHDGAVHALAAANASTSGPPQIAAETTIKGSTATTGTRSQLLFWPIADQNYTIQVTYKYLPDALTGLLPYPPGGAEHAELFKASCLACAELQLDDASGVRQRQFMQLLTASVHADRKRKGTWFGYNGDNSDNTYRGNRLDRNFWGDPVTYNGQPL